MDPSPLLDAIVDASNRQTEELRRSTLAFIIMNRHLAGLPLDEAEVFAGEIYKRAIRVSQGRSS